MTPSSLAERARELVAVQGAEPAPAPGHLRPGEPRFPGVDDSVLRQQQVLPADRSRRSTPDIGQNFAGAQNSSIWSFQPTWTLMRGKHTFPNRCTISASTTTSSFQTSIPPGRYVFNRGNVFTKQLDNSPAAAIGQDLAAFVLGYPSGGVIDRSADRFNQVLYNGVFFQDDWRVTSKLTAQPRRALGVRDGARRAVRSQRSRLRSGRLPEHHRRCAGRLRGEPDSRRSSEPVPRTRWHAVRRRGQPAVGRRGPEQFPATRWGLPTSWTKRPSYAVGMPSTRCQRSST